ncbi:FtsX-like permease family protein [Agromyces sp. Marseille-Q5079]|uniref:FtsX-like permease family protein n=1 Tax=Agromyces sp. Marseille-Q5079 TaxID=3439059 RepID=UPI003D9CB41D
MIARVAWLLARPGTGGAAATVLPVVAFGVVTALLATVAGGAQTFFTWTDDSAVLYQILAVIALVLLVVPLVSLGGAAARLSARRRDDRLATLRLLGATPSTVRTLAVLEASALAFAGAVAGVLGSLLLAPAIGLIHFRGEALGTAEVVLPWFVLVAAPFAIAALAAVSAVLGLRQVVISPLGVRTRQDAPRLHWVRVVVGVAVVALGYAITSAIGVAQAALVLMAMLAIAFGGTLAVLNLVGPWVLRLVATGQARRAKTPARLLSARSVLESPKVAWRQVGGVAMTSFMAVFAGVGVGLLDAAGTGGDAASRMLLEDIRTGIVITVVGSFLMVACSVGVNQAAATLDRADLYRSLDMLGMPITTMDAARRRSVMSPLLITTIGSAVIAAVVLLPLTGISLIIAPLSLLTVVAVLAAGVGIVWIGLAVTKPVLERAASPAAG